MCIVFSFRGEFAAASLKRANLSLGLGVRVCLPRRIRRGLIEASDWKLERNPFIWPFRGEFAAASLKLLGD